MSNPYLRIPRHKRWSGRLRGFPRRVAFRLAPALERRWQRRWHERLALRTANATRDVQSPRPITVASDAPPIPPPPGVADGPDES